MSTASQAPAPAPAFVLLHLPFRRLPPPCPASKTTCVASPPQPRFPSRTPNPRLSSVASLYLPPRSSPLFPAHTGPPPPRPPYSSHPHRNSDDNHLPPSNPLAPVLPLLSHLLNLYNSRLSTHPLLTKSITSSILVLLSDLLAQSLTNPPSTPFNLPRLLRYSLYGLVIAGPQGHFWFQLLHRLLPHSRPTSILCKVLADQLLYSPLVTGIFFALMQVAEGASVAHATAFARRHLPSTMSYAWRVWPVVVAVNFAVVPTPYQVMFVSSVSVLWVAFLSLVANQSAVSEASV